MLTAEMVLEHEHDTLSRMLAYARGDYPSLLAIVKRELKLNGTMAFTYRHDGRMMIALKPTGCGCSHDCCGCPFGHRFEVIQHEEYWFIIYSYQRNY